MKKFIMLYSGPAAPPNPSHAGWPEWFQKIGEALVDRGSPLINGVSVRSDGVSSAALKVNGYSIIQAEAMEEAHRLLADHPYLALGAQYTIELFEIPKKQHAVNKDRRK